MPDPVKLPDDFLREAQGKKLFASFSGGADSTALVLLLAQSGLPFHAVHFTHGIRDPETGEREWELCRAFCNRYQVPVERHLLRVPEMRQPREGLEAAARRCRLNAWHKILAGKKEECRVLTAHHADDVRENLLLRLFRGGNVSSLAGLRSRSTVDGITFLRPLLDFSKRDLNSFLLQNGITNWAEDLTNREDSAARNFLRNKILPAIAEKLAFAPGGIRASAAALAEDADYLETEAKRESEKDLENAATWRDMHPAIRIRVMRLFLSRASGKNVIPDWRMMQRFARLLEQPFTRRIRKMPVPGTKLEITRSGNRIGIRLKAEEPTQTLSPGD